MIPIVRSLKKEGDEGMTTLNQLILAGITAVLMIAAICVTLWDNRRKKE